MWVLECESEAGAAVVWVFWWSTSQQKTSIMGFAESVYMNVNWKTTKNLFDAPRFSSLLKLLTEKIKTIALLLTYYYFLTYSFKKKIFSFAWRIKKLNNPSRPILRVQRRKKTQMPANCWWSWSTKKVAKRVWLSNSQKWCLHIIQALKDFDFINMQTAWCAKYWAERNQLHARCDLPRIKLTEAVKIEIKSRYWLCPNWSAVI